MSLPQGARIVAEELAARLKQVFGLCKEIAAVYLFGSVAREKAGPESDLDLGVVFRRRGDDPEHHELASELAYEVGKRVDWKRIDVVLLEAQGPIFCHQVLCEGCCIYEGDRDRRIDFESETTVRAFDFRPTWELATRGKGQALRRWLRKRYDLR